MKFLSLALMIILFTSSQLMAQDWTIDSAEDWTQNIASAEGASVTDGAVSPTAKTATVVTKIHQSDVKRAAKSLNVTQSALWQNWNPVENIGPVNLSDAPVLLTLGPDNYWIFGRYRSSLSKRKKGQEAKKDTPKFEPKEATLEGFDMPLQTTQFPNQFNAPGGLKAPSLKNFPNGSPAPSTSMAKR